MRMKSGLYVTLAATALMLSGAALKNASAAGDAKAEITAIENATVKADMSGDKTFYEKTLAADWTGGDSSGKWFTKADMIKMMTDTKDNKMNSEKLSDIKVRTYGDTAIATYTDTYDAVIMGEHRTRTVISTDTFVKQGGMWKLVAGHSSTVGK
jgi:uncharacterized protein DUF4440